MAMQTTEDIFRGYTAAQGQNYSMVRPGYSPELFKIIIDHHTSTGGQLHTVVDVGCGPGQAIKDLAPFFETAVGLDPSEGMIDTARDTAKSANLPIRFEVSTAEALGIDLQPPISAGSVDLLTAATAAHWFDMAGFWKAAARILKPGGTVAIWTRSGARINTTKTPNGAAIQAALDELYSDLRPWARAGNMLTHDLYINLPLPWTLEVPVAEFDKDSFVRKEWNRDGSGAENEAVPTGGPVTPEQFEKIMGTSSPVSRWREAHPDKVGTEEDLVRKLRRRMESLLHEAGVKPGEEVMSGEVAMALLLVKKI
ncbi:S-adenosyl-L-methionine-dependent methyltransferase [Trichoderma austrokoningii]